MVLNGTQWYEIQKTPVSPTRDENPRRQAPRHALERRRDGAVVTVSGLRVGSPRSSLFESKLRREVIAICPLSEKRPIAPQTFQQGQPYQKTQRSRSFAANAKYGRRQPDTQAEIPSFEMS
jgi:hypothetical protein